ERLKDIMREFAPEAVAIESIFFSKNVRSAIMLGHVRGVALICAASMGIEAFEYSPRSIKESVVGYGAATKDQVQKMVQVLLKKNKKNVFFTPDAADALAAAICHIHTNGPNAKAART
ncbi:MAG: crossover junction endodeoxyribonuclease RuvC, partial [Deltaproteobacteria bacterium]|nr:crossover junction endodeoxyribonuclease RuvC [Deltaproteobacteria bacterium]